MYDPDLIPCNIPDGDHLHELEIRKYLARGVRERDKIEPTPPSILSLFTSHEMSETLKKIRKGAAIFSMAIGSYGISHESITKTPYKTKRTPREFGDYILALEIGESMGGRVLG